MSKNSFNDSLKTILGFELTQNQHEALRIYEKELLEWNENVNLTAIRDVEGIRVKHFLDSLTVLLGWERKDPPERIIDVGTGAGFPGLILKLVWPKTQVTLVESVHKKAEFCNHIVERLALKEVTVVVERAEVVGQDSTHRQSYDLAVARAVARMPILMEYLLPFVRPQAVRTLAKLMGSDALPDLVALSDDLNLHVRRAVAQSLAGIENLTPEAKSALIRLSQDEETAEFARDAVEVHDLTAITSLPFTKREVKVPFPGELSGSSELLLDLLKTWQESLPEMQRQFDLEELAEVDRALSSLIIYLRDAKNDSSPEF